MFTCVMLAVLAAFALVFFKIITTSKYTATDDSFEQAGGRVDFTTNEIPIGRKTYGIEAVQGISSKKVSSIGTEVTINMDDFKRPIHKIGITGMGDAGDQFVQRLYPAIHKAGGTSFC